VKHKLATPAISRASEQFFFNAGGTSGTKHVCFVTVGRPLNDGMLCYPWSFLPVMAPWFKSIIKHLHRHPKTATSLLLADSPGAEQTKGSWKAEPLETDVNYNQRQSYPNLHYIHITSSVKLGWNLAFHIYIKPMPLTLACHSSGWLMRVPVVDSW